MGKLLSGFFCTEKNGLWLLLLLVVVLSVEVSAGEEGEYSHSYYTDMVYQYLESDESKVVLKEPRDELEMTRIWIDKRENVHVRFRQVLDGVPVWGGELLVHMRSDGGVYNVNSSVVEGVGRTMPEVSLSPKECIVIISELLDGKYKRAKIGKPELLIDLVGGFPRKVYKVEVFTGLKREFLFIDASNGELDKGLSGSPTM